MQTKLLRRYRAAVEHIDPVRYMGRVERVQGLLIESRGPRAAVGELCQIVDRQSGRRIAAEVVGMSGRNVRLMPYSETNGIEIGQEVIANGYPLRVPVTPKLIGRVLDSRAHCIDSGPQLIAEDWYPLMNRAPNILQRNPIDKQLTTGVRAIDAFTPIGTGQRMGIFSGSGIGKSTLIGMIARHTSADVNVIALVGERGREVKEFIQDNIGENGLERSVVVVATSDAPPLARLRAAFVATTIAEYFRDQDKNVLLLFDSITRFARAQREIGLAAGEPPATRGFPPSVFELLPRLLERCGTAHRGTITGIYSILVEGDDLDEPISDAVRGILDGHVTLSRRLAQRNHYPAIDVLDSVSRLIGAITTEEQRTAIGAVRRKIALYADAEDLINAGAYVRGSNPETDASIACMPDIERFLMQKTDERVDRTETFLALQRLAELSAGGTPSEQSTEQSTERSARQEVR